MRCARSRCRSTRFPGISSRQEVASEQRRETNHCDLENDAPALIRCYREWMAILERPLGEICQILCADTEEGRRLRQNSPFAGVLPPAEVWSIKAAIRQRHAKTAA